MRHISAWLLPSGLFTACLHVHHVMDNHLHVCTCSCGYVCAHVPVDMCAHVPVDVCAHVPVDVCAHVPVDVCACSFQVKSKVKKYLFHFWKC